MRDEREIEVAGFPRLDLIIHDAAHAAGIEQDEAREYTPRVSNSGECPRMLAFQARGTPTPPRTGRMGVFLDDGNVHEEATVRWMDFTSHPVGNRQLPLTLWRVNGASYLIKKEYQCSTCGDMVSRAYLHGHIDGTIKHGKENMLWEHKACSRFRFDRLHSLGEWPIGYITQCCCYIIGLNEIGIRCTKAILLVKSRDTSAYLSYGIEYDQRADAVKVIALWVKQVKLFEKVVKRFEDTLNEVEKSIVDKAYLPERPYVDPQEPPCTWCRYNRPCWEGYAGEILARKEGVLDSGDELIPLLVELRTLRDVTSGTEKREKAVREQILQAFKARKLRAGSAVSSDGKLYTFGLTPSDRTYLNREKIPANLLAEATEKSFAQTLNVREVKAKPGAPQASGAKKIVAKKTKNKA